jgi:MoaA/NifB/PqqE/SkfB family radical SAM enzyme
MTRQPLAALETVERYPLVAEARVAAAAQLERVGQNAPILGALGSHGSQVMVESGIGIAPEAVTFAWLELTNKCQEECGHCYNKSGPDGSHGEMTKDDWKSTIDQLHDRGIRMVQFIGGEPTLYPGLPDLVQHALGKDGMTVEVYTNMVHIKPELKELFVRHKDRVFLATSYYSKDPSVHQEITGRNTRNPIGKNIRWATENGMELRVGIIDILDGQNIEGAIEDLVELGVDPARIGTDRVREIGRGVQDEVTPEITSQLCGNCANGVVAVLPDGSLQPCVFSRQSDFTIGNLLHEPLSEALGGERFVGVRSLLRQVFASRRISAKCSPDGCSPDDFCKPDANCSPDDYCRPHMSDDASPETQIDNCRPTCEPNCSPSTGGGDDCKPDRTCFPLTTPCKPASRTMAKI